MKRVNFNEYADFLNKNPNLSKLENFPDLQEDLRINRAFQDTISDGELKEQISRLSSDTASTYQKYGFDIGVEYALKQIEPTTISDIMREVQKLIQTVMHALKDVAPSKESLRYVLSLADDKIEDLQMEILDKKEALYSKTQEPMDKGQPTIDMIS